MSDFKKRYEVDKNQPKIISFQLEKQKRESRDRIKKAEEEFERKIYEGEVPVKYFSSIEDLEEDLKREELIRKEEARKKAENERLYAKKGTAHRVKQKSQKNKMRKTRTAALVLSFVLGAGAVTGHFVSKHNQPAQDVGELVEQKVDINSLGLSQETINTIIEYNKFFENGEERENVDTARIIEMTQEIYNLNLRIVKEKMSFLTGYDVANIKVHYSSDKADARAASTVSIYEDPNNTVFRPIERYSDIGAKVIPIADEYTLPEGVCDIIWNLESLSNLKNEIENHEISDKKALKQLEKLFEEIDDFGGMELIRGENGKLALIKYSGGTKKEIEVEREDEER